MTGKTSPQFFDTDIACTLTTPDQQNGSCGTLVGKKSQTWQKPDKNKWNLQKDHAAGRWNINGDGESFMPHLAIWGTQRQKPQKSNSKTPMRKRSNIRGQKNRPNNQTTALQGKYVVLRSWRAFTEYQKTPLPNRSTRV